LRVFKLKAFERFQRREQIADTMLVQAINRAAQGSIDAALGGGLIKQRVARPAQGRSSGYRTIIAYKSGQRAVFLFGFAKRERDNIGSDELAAWRRIGRIYLALDGQALRAAIEAGEITEIDHGTSH
jgi:hypothetical protein